MGPFPFDFEEELTLFFFLVVFHIIDSATVGTFHSLLLLHTHTYEPLHILFLRLYVVVDNKSVNLF